MAAGIETAPEAREAKGWPLAGRETGLAARVGAWGWAECWAVGWAEGWAGSREG